MLPRTLAFTIAALLLTVSAACGGDDPPATAEEEQVLKDAKIASDGPSLLEFFRKQILSARQVERIDALVSQLGDEDFKVRERATAELKGVGTPALARLRLALKDKDAEVRWRAEVTIQSIEQNNEGPWIVAAARLLKVRRPAGAVPLLLDYLPFAAGPEVEEEVLAALTVLGVQDGKVDPALGAALQEKAPVKRAAAAMLVGWTGTPEQRAAVKEFLADADPRVRLSAAQGLLAARDKTVLPTLLALMKDAPLPIAEEAEGLLARAAGDEAPTVSLGPDEAARKRGHAAWETWLRTKGDQIDLAKADVSLPAFNSPARVREAAVRFAIALYSRDAAGMKKRIGYPFFFPGTPAFTRLEDLQQYLGGPRVDLRKLTITARGGEPITAREYAATATASGYVATWLETEKQFLTEQRGRDVRVVYLTITNSIPGDALSTALVRVSGGQPRVIGLGVGKPPAKGEK
jgi:HEAT repeat protein